MYAASTGRPRTPLLPRVPVTPAPTRCSRVGPLPPSAAATLAIQRGQHQVQPCSQPMMVVARGDRHMGRSRGSHEVQVHTAFPWRCVGSWLAPASSPVRWTTGFTHQDPRRCQDQAGKLRLLPGMGAQGAVRRRARSFRPAGGPTSPSAATRTRWSPTNGTRPTRPPASASTTRLGSATSTSAGPARDEEQEVLSLVKLAQLGPRMAQVHTQALQLERRADRSARTCTRTQHPAS
jgi:hypothetical protein